MDNKQSSTQSSTRKRKDPEQVLAELAKKTQAAKERLRKRDTKLKILFGAYYINELKNHADTDWYIDELESMKNYFNDKDFALIKAYLDKLNKNS